MSGSNEKRHKTTKGTAMNYVGGNLNLESRNDEKFMAVKESAGDGVTAMNFYDTNAVATVRSVGGVSMMAVGYEGEELKNIADTYKEVTGKKIPIKITVQIQGAVNGIFDPKESPTSTISEIRFQLMKKYERFFKIFRDGKELEDNLTMAQAAQTGSTVNWIAKEGRHKE